MKDTFPAEQDDPALMDALYAIVRALDEKFPDGNTVFQRVSRLCEESGELASAVNHMEGMGVKKQKYGEAGRENLIKEMQDVMRAVLGIAKHYNAEEELRLAVEATYRRYQKEGLIKARDGVGA